MDRDVWYIDTNNDAEVGLGVLGILIYLIGFGINLVISIALFLITHFYIVNGLMAGAIPAVLMYSSGCETTHCVVICGIVALIVIILQLNIKAARVVFGIFGCGLVAVITWRVNIEMGNTDVKSLILYSAIAAAVTGLFNLIGYGDE